MGSKQEELHKEHADVIRREELRVERLMTAREIFEAGYNIGQSQAGIRSGAFGFAFAFNDWLLARAER
jgi:hypothetical protein